MSKFSLARRLADKAGTSFSRARRFVDDVGTSKAARTADNAADDGGRTVRNWLKPAAIGGTAVGGGALIWRQQDVQRAKALSQSNESYSESIKSIMEDDSLSASQKESLVDQLNEEFEAPSGDGGDEDDGGWPPDLPDFLSGTQGTVIIIIVLVVVLQTTLGDGQ